MKKKFVFAAIVALMGIGYYFSNFDVMSTERFSDIELANAEALADMELWDRNCEHRVNFVCVLGPSSVIYDSIGETDPEYPGY